MKIPSTLRIILLNSTPSSEDSRTAFRRLLWPPGTSFPCSSQVLDTGAQGMNAKKEKYGRRGQAETLNPHHPSGPSQFYQALCRLA